MNHTREDVRAVAESLAIPRWCAWLILWNIRRRNRNRR